MIGANVGLHCLENLIEWNSCWQAIALLACLRYDSDKNYNGKSDDYLIDDDGSSSHPPGPAPLPGFIGRLRNCCGAMSILWLVGDSAGEQGGNWLAGAGGCGIFAEMKVILMMVIGSVFAAALALVRNFPGFFWPESCVGKIRSFQHTQPRTIEVDCEDRSVQKFFIADNTKIATSTNPAAGFQSLQIGDPIKISFTRKGAACWAQSIVLHR